MDQLRANFKRDCERATGARAKAKCKNFRTRTAAKISRVAFAVFRCLAKSKFKIVSGFQLTSSAKIFSKDKRCAARPTGCATPKTVPKNPHKNQIKNIHFSTEHYVFYNFFRFRKTI